MKMRMRKMQKTNHKAIKTHVSKLITRSILADGDRKIDAKGGSHHLLVMCNKLTKTNAQNRAEILSFLLRTGKTPTINRAMKTHVVKLLTCSTLAGCGRTIDANGRSHHLMVTNKQKTKRYAKNTAELLLIFIVFMVNPECHYSEFSLFGIVSVQR